MSYDISFKVKVDGVDAYVPVGACDANKTWNVRKIIEKSTGLEWKNCQNNGLCVDVIPKIEAGLRTLEQNPDSFKEYEEPNGWGTVKETAQFFRNILNDWNDFQQWYEELVPVTTFWIECWLLTEATGLTPEEIKAPFTEDTMINLAAQALGVEPSRLRELAEADKAGRVVVLPCKGYSSIDIARDGVSYRPDHWNIYLTAYAHGQNAPSGLKVGLFDIGEVERAMEGAT